MDLARLATGITALYPFIVIALVVLAYMLGWAYKRTLAANAKTAAGRARNAQILQFVQGAAQRADLTDGAAKLAWVAPLVAKLDPRLSPDVVRADIEAMVKAFNEGARAQVPATVLSVAAPLLSSVAPLRAADVTATATTATAGIAPADLDAFRAEMRAIAPTAAQDALRVLLAPLLAGQDAAKSPAATESATTGATAATAATAPFKIVDAATNEAVADVTLPAAQTTPLTGGAPTP